MIVLPNKMMEEKGKGYHGIRAIEAFECENTRSDFKCCHYWESQYESDIMHILFVKLILCT